MRIRVGLCAAATILVAGCGPTITPAPTAPMAPLTTPVPTTVPATATPAPTATSAPVVDLFGTDLRPRGRDGGRLDDHR